MSPGFRWLNAEPSLQCITLATASLFRASAVFARRATDQILRCWLFAAEFYGVAVARCG